MAAPPAGAPLPPRNPLPTDPPFTPDIRPRGQLSGEGKGRGQRCRLCVWLSQTKVQRARNPDEWSPKALGGPWVVPMPMPSLGTGRVPGRKRSVLDTLAGPNHPGNAPPPPARRGREGVGVTRWEWPVRRRLPAPSCGLSSVPPGPLPLALWPARGPAQDFCGARRQALFLPLPRTWARGLTPSVPLRERAGPALPSHSLGVSGCVHHRHATGKNEMRGLVSRSHRRDRQSAV